MRRTFQAAPVVGRRTAVRALLTLANFVAAAAISIALAWQITDLVQGDAFNPQRYFSYFTIHTSIANVALLLACGITGLRTLRDGPVLTALRASFVSYAVVTGGVYNALLRDLPPAEGAWVSTLTWPNEVTHVWIPLYFVLDWLINPHRHPLPGWSLPVGLVFPLVWIGFTLARGELTGWYPYDFLNPGGPAGWAGVGIYVGAIGAVVLVVFAATILTNLLHQKLRRPRAIPA